MPQEFCAFDGGDGWQACTRLCNNDNDCPEFMGVKASCEDSGSYKACAIPCAFITSNCPGSMECFGGWFSDFCAYPD